MYKETEKSFCIDNAKRRILWFNKFTLIELLVVIAVISLLVSILLPALSKVKETAKSIQCKNNLKQMFITVESYSSDYGSYIPPARFYSVDSKINGVSEPYWFAYLYRFYLSNMSGMMPYSLYCKNLKKSIFTCPSLPIENWSHNYPGYGFNINLARTLAVNGSGTWEEQSGTPVKNTLLRYPSEQLIVADRLNNWHVDDKNYSTSLDFFRHQTTCNLLYCDGHTDAKSLSEFQASKF